MSLKIDDISYVYDQGTAMSVSALNHISVEIPDGQFIGLVGHTGSGKSTVAVLLGNFLLFTVVFSVLGLALKNVLNLNDYLSVFWYFLAFGEGLGLFDLLVIDLLWWRRIGSLDRHAVLNHTS